MLKFVFLLFALLAVAFAAPKPKPSQVFVPHSYVASVPVHSVASYAPVSSVASVAPVASVASYASVSAPVHSVPVVHYSSPVVNSYSVGYASSPYHYVY